MIDLHSDRTAVEYYTAQIQQAQTDPRKKHKIPTILKFLEESGMCPLHNPDLKPS